MNRASILHRFFIYLALLSVSSLCFHALHAQIPAATAGRIAHDQALLTEAEQQHAPPERLGFLWVLLASNLQQAADFPNAEQAYNKALNLFGNLPTERANYAAVLDDLGSLYLNFNRLDEGARCREQAYAVRLKLGDPRLIARSHQHLAEIALLRHKYKDAAREADQAAQDLTRFQQVDRDRISALITSSLAHCMMHDCPAGRRSAEQAVSLARTISPKSWLAVGESLMALGFTQWNTDGDEQAAASLHEGLQVLQAELPPDSPLLLGALKEYRNFLKHAHRDDEARALEADLAARMHPPQAACTGCTTSVYALRSPSSSSQP